MKETLQAKLIRLARESEQELREIGLGNKLRDDVTYTINTRASQRFGQCVGKTRINISKWLLEIGTDHDIKDTIIHEILHTFLDTRGHKGKWQYYANIVNANTDYHISRLGSVNEVYINANIQPPKREDNANYKLICAKCGRIWYQQRLTHRTLTGFICGNRIHKRCGGTRFEVVDLRNGEVLC